MRRDEIVAPWVIRLLTRCRAGCRAYLRKRRQRCIRCGAPAAGECDACGALTCDRCWLPSIETGQVAALCLDCTAAPRSFAPGRFDPAGSIRSGVVALGWLLAAVTTWAYWTQGARGSWRVIASLLDPGMLLGLVPLAFLLGGVRALLIRFLQALVRSPSKQSR